MKTLKKLVATVGCIILGLIIFSSCTYVTKANNFNVVKQFGKIQHIEETPGLGFNIPILQNVTEVPKSKQFYDLKRTEVTTSDKKTMIVDAYVIWKVTDAKTFTSSLNADMGTAENRINNLTYNAIKNSLSTLSQEELILSRDTHIEVNNGVVEEDIQIDNVVTDENGEIIESETTTSTEDVKIVSIEEMLLKELGTQYIEDYGFEITSIEIKTLDPPEENKTAIYDRMKTERDNIAATYLAQGNSEAKIIMNQADKEVALILAEADAEAAKIIAEGEAEYMQILSEAYNDSSKADFYLFKLALDSAKASLNGGDDVLFLSEDSPLAEVFMGTN